MLNTKQDDSKNWERNIDLKMRHLFAKAGRCLVLFTVVWFIGASVLDREAVAIEKQWKSRKVGKSL